MLAAQGPVGTRGGVEWMRGAGACPGWGATCLLHAVPTGSRCHQDKHQVYDFPSSSPQGSVGSSKRLSFGREGRTAKERTKRSQRLRYNGAEKEVVCFS